MPKPMGDDKRSFTIQKDSFGYDSGRFIATTPSIAAKHAARVCFRMARESGSPYARFAGRDSITMAIEERTRGSARKVFYYRVTREKKPINAKRETFLKSKKIKSEYVYRVLSIDETTFRSSLGSR